ncbi:MAG: MOSC domain-containing protein [Actinomycetota bacterium]
MANIEALHLHEIETQKPRATGSVTITSGGGLEGDSHKDAREKRRVLVVDSSVLRVQGLTPGDLREQITVDGLAVDDLVVGSMIRIGAAQAIVVKPCEPCTTIGGYLGVDDVEAFRDSMKDQRGVFVLFREEDAGTQLYVGDEVAEC